MKTEIWNGHEIRFVEKDGEWWAVLMDVTHALGLKTFDVRRRLQEDMVSTHTLETTGGPQKMLAVNEIGIYKAILQSRKPEAVDFQNWTFNVLKSLRQASGLEGFQIFRMLDKEHQCDAMRTLRDNLRHPAPVDFIKCNVITDKAISTKYGYPKMVKKADMTPAMLVDRQSVLADTVELMAINDKFGLGLSVSEQIYRRQQHPDRPAV